MADIQAQIGTATQSTANSSDQELLDRFVATRDEAAFARLVERHGGTIWRLCRRILRKEHDAEDAYQAAFLVLSRKASSIRRGAAVRSWLYQVTYRIAMKARFRLQRRRDREKRTEDVACDNPPWGAAALREMQRILDHEVDRLDEKRRAPFVLCCLEGMSKPEAARELGWPEDTVKARLAQARKLLQNRLARRGITLSAALTAVALAQSAAAAAAPAVLAISVGQAAALSPSALTLAGSFVSGIGAAKLKLALAVSLFVAMTVTGACLTALHLGSDAQEPDLQKNALAVNDPETFLAPPTPLIMPHDEQVLAVALSPDGKRLVTAGARHTLPGQFMIWDVEKQRELVRVRGLSGIRGVAFSPDGKNVACGTFGGAIQLRDAQTGKEQAALVGHKIGVNAVAYSADGNWLASAGLDKTVKLWDVNKHAESKSFVGHTDMVFSAAYFRHGTAIVSGGKDRTAKIWDIDSGKVKFNLTCPSAVEAVAISPDDKLVATGCWDQTIRLWSADTGKEEAVLQSSEGLILAVAFSSDGTLLASSSTGGAIRVWDVKTRQTIKHLKGHASSTWSIAFMPNNKVLATGSSDKTAKLWDIETGREMATLTTAQSKRVQSIAYAPDGKSLAIAGEDKFVQVRDAKSGHVRLVLGGHTDIVNCVAISPDGSTLASGSSDKTIKLRWLSTGKEWATIRGHSARVLALAFAKDGSLASAGEDRLIKWWDRPKGRRPITFRGHDHAVCALAFAPDGETLASGCTDGSIRIWVRGKDIPVRILTAHAGSVRALAYAPDGLLASAGDDGAVKVWEAGADKEKCSLSGHTGAVLSLAFTPSGTLVSGGADRQAIVWDIATGKPRTKLLAHTGAVTALVIHPQGDHLITGSDDRALLRWRSSASAQQPARATPIVAGAPPVKPDAGGEIYVPLTSRPDNLPRKNLVGRNAEKFVRFETSGMRLTVPPGFKGVDAHAVLGTGMALKGDFEATVNFEILHLPEPEEAGPETGVTLSVRRDKTDICVTGVTRRVVKTGGPQFSAWATWFEQPGQPSTHKEKLKTSGAKTGRLRLVRIGGDLSYYASEGLDANFTLLNQLPIGEADLEDLRLLGFTGDPRASLDARFWDLRIRMGTFPQLLAGAAAPADATAEEPNAGSREWLTALALVACLLAMLTGAAFFLRRRRFTPGISPSAPADDTSAAARSISFSCSCGKSLRAKAGLAGKERNCPACGAPILIPGKR